jgi:transposase
MQDHVSRLVGLERFEVKRVLEERDRLELEVELVARAGCYPRWGGRRSRSRTAPRARVRDLPIAGRITHLLWRKRRYHRAGCGQGFTESHPELPPRQRVTRRFRPRPTPRHRTVGGGARSRPHGSAAASN